MNANWTAPAAPAVVMHCLMSTPHRLATPPGWRACSGSGALAVLLWPLTVATEFRPWVLFEPDNLRLSSHFLGSFLPPATQPDFLLLVARETWRTVAMATAGITLALLLAVPLTLLSTAGTVDLGPVRAHGAGAVLAAPARCTGC